MSLWIGRVHGVAVGAAMSYRTDEAVGIFGVATIPSARGRGYGSALTRRSLLLDSGLPAILGPSLEAERMYLRLGFEQVGKARHWRPGPVTRTEPDLVRT
jgi:predicted GNAT family acetyltransferase